MIPRQIQHIMTERDVLTVSSSPWLVKLLYAFKDVDHVYLAMEYVPGGDLRTLINTCGAMAEEDARFYICEMLRAVADLHAMGFLHRCVCVSVSHNRFQ